MPREPKKVKARYWKDKWRSQYEFQRLRRRNSSKNTRQYHYRCVVLIQKLLSRWIVANTTIDEHRRIYQEDWRIRNTVLVLDPGSKRRCFFFALKVWWDLICEDAVVLLTKLDCHCCFGHRKNIDALVAVELLYGYLNSYVLND